MCRGQVASVHAKLTVRPAYGSLKWLCLIIPVWAGAAVKIAVRQTNTWVQILYHLHCMVKSQRKIPKKARFLMYIK